MFHSTTASIRRRSRKAASIAAQRLLQSAAGRSIELLENRVLLSVSSGLHPSAAVNTTLAAEGTVEVDLRASDLAAGSVNSWNNEGTSGGSFTPWKTAAPTVGSFTDANNVTYQAVSFDGTTALTSGFNAPADLTGNSARSIEVWVLNPTIDNGEETMVSWARRGGPDGTNESFSYGNNYTVGEWGGEYDMTWAGSAIPNGPTTAPTQNVWHNLTFTYDGMGGAAGGGTEDVYVDGQLQLSGPSNGMGTGTINALATAVGFPINLGAQNDGSGNPAVFGSLDIASVRISSGALTAADVQQNFAAGVPGQSTPTSAPAAAPVLATPIANDKIVQLSWSYVGDAGTGFSYDVFRSDASHPTPTAVATNLTTLSYSDTSVTNGVQYTYYVVAKNSAGSGPHSNTVNATPVPKAPATPTNFTAGRVGVSTNVALSWTASVNAPAGTTYDVKRGTSLNGDGSLGGTIVDITPGGISGTTATDTNAATNGTYYYAVTATDSGGSSAASPAVKVGPVTAVNTTLAAEGTVEVDLRASDLTSGGPWTNEGTAGGVFNPAGATAPAVGAFTDANGLTYRAVSFNGSDQAYSSSFNAPADLTGNNARSIEVWVLNPVINGVEETMVSWAHRGGPDGTNESFSYGNTYGVGEWGAEYDMTYTQAMGNVNGAAPAANIWHYLTFTYDGNGNENVYVDGKLDLSGAQNGTNPIAALMTAAGFPVTIGAQNGQNGGFAIFGSLDIAGVRVSAGALTAADVAQNFAAGVPGQSAPTHAPNAAPTLNAPVVGDSIVQLNWSYVGDAGSGFSYTLLRSDPAHPTPTAIATGLHSLSYTDLAVTDGTTYTYTVEAVNSAGAGPASNAVMATPVAAAPATPTNLTVSRIGESPDVLISFTPDQFPNIKYDVQRGTALNGNGTIGGTIVDITPGGTSSSSVTDTTSNPNTTYYYTVTASTPGGTSAPATPVMLAAIPSTAGLYDSTYHLGGGNSNAFDNVFGGNLAALMRVANFAANNPANYSFINTADTFNYNGGSAALTPAFLGADANGPATTDPDNVNDTIFDAMGSFTAPTAGNYTFTIGNGMGGQADDIVGVYVNGNGTPGSGTLVAADGWQGATSPFEVSPTMPGQATFMLPAGTTNVEIIYGNGFGGANLNGVTITDPNGMPVVFNSQVQQQAAVTLTGVAITDGSTNTNQTQRSEVREIALSFSGPVTLGAGALKLSLLNTGGSGKNDGSAPTDASAALGTPTTPDGGKTWIIPIAKSTAFSDATGSLSDGIYTVTVNPADVTGGTLTGTNLSTTFHRLFGDITGSKTVNNGDYLKFKAAYLSSTGNPKFNADFDYDANGTINNADFLQFKKRYLKVFTY